MYVCVCSLGVAIIVFEMVRPCGDIFRAPLGERVI